MTDDGFTHDATNKLSVIYFYLDRLHKDAIAHINEPNAIEVRDFCADQIHRIDMFTRQKALESNFNKTEGGI